MLDTKHRGSKSPTTSRSSGDILRLKPCISRKLIIQRDGPIVGVDVGEDFLDLAIISGDRATLSYHRVPLEGITNPVAPSLSDRIAAVTPIDLQSAVAFVDSPRTPLDADCSLGTMTGRVDTRLARFIDGALRDLLRSSATPLSMFPTPRANYFAGCIARRDCKPHLRAIGQELLASIIEPCSPHDGSIRGGTFTRFMLVGFATFLALERNGIRAYECYPDLQFRLWADGIALAPKKIRREALLARQSICMRLAEVVGVREFKIPGTLDEADGAVLALSAAASAKTESLLELHCPAEGRFAVAFRV